METLSRKIVVITTSSILLTACGGSSISAPPPPALAEVPKLDVLQSSLSPLDNSASKVESVIKNGVYLRSLQPLVPTYQTSVPEASADTKGNNFSTTITQEANVDEADRIKYDGDYLYIVSNGNYPELLSIAQGSQTEDELPAGSRKPRLRSRYAQAG